MNIYKCEIKKTSSQTMKVIIHAVWDTEAQIRVAQSENVPGLATEANTIEALTAKLRNMIPELLMLNNLISENYSGSINFELNTMRQELIRVGS